MQREIKRMNINYRVSLSFARLSDSDLDEFTNKTINCLTGSAVFTAPPIAMTDLQKLLDSFRIAIAEATAGGAIFTAAKNVVREQLLVALRKTAAYVQIVAAQDMATMLTSGFLVNSTNRARTKLDVPSIVAVDNGGTTKLTVSLQPVQNARAYQVRGSTGNNGTTTTLPTIDSTQTRSIEVANLVPDRKSVV